MCNTSKKMYGIMEEQKMKKIEWSTKEGKSGVRFVAEVGDVVTSKYDTTRESLMGKFKNFSLGIEKASFECNAFKEERIPDSKEKKYVPLGKTTEEIEYLQITGGQSTKLNSLGGLTGKEIEFYGYENVHGDQIGARIKK